MRNSFSNNLSCTMFSHPLEGQVLSLPRTSYTDAGVYSCTAQNKAGQDELSYVVEVQIEPQITLLDKKVSVEEGQQARLHCSADGIPIPTISWYKDDQLITKPDPDFSFEFDELIIKRANSAYAGLYKCVARSGLVTFDL